MKIRKISLSFVLGLLLCVPTVAQVRSFTVNLEALKSEMSKVTSEEMKMMLEDASEETRQKMKEDPQARAMQIRSIRELMAMGIQAIRDGIAAEPPVKNEIAFLTLQAVAINYSRVLAPNGQGLAPVPAKMIADFYKAPETVRFFEEYAATNAEFLRMMDPDAPALTAADKAQLKEEFAKVNILFMGYAPRAAELGKALESKMALETKMQSAQLLARIYIKRNLEAKIAVSEEDIDRYIAKHPEFSTAPQKRKAEEMLKRALAGEDFAELARQFSEDPGSKAAGGLYSNVPKGKFLPEIEDAAYALKPGEISPAVVESTLGFHVIRLERKTANSMTFRHIMISTMVNDPDKPSIGGPAVEGANGTPYRDFLRKRLEKEKENNALESIIAANPVEIGDF